MIAVDTSALMAVILEEEKAPDCIAALETEAGLLISAVTVAESLIVADGRNVSTAMNKLLHGLGFEIVPVTNLSARRVLDIYKTWGKGNHRASLNFGDCFSYDAAKSNGCPLLYVGDDFRKTDIASVLR